MDAGRGVRRVLSEGRRMEGEPCRSAPAPRLIRFVSSPALGGSCPQGEEPGAGEAQPGGMGRVVCVCVKTLDQIIWY